MQWVILKGNFEGKNLRTFHECHVASPHADAVLSNEGVASEAVLPRLTQEQLRVHETVPTILIPDYKSLIYTLTMRSTKD